MATEVSSGNSSPDPGKTKKYFCFAESWLTSHQHLGPSDDWTDQLCVSHCDGWGGKVSTFDCCQRQPDPSHT